MISRTTHHLEELDGFVEMGMKEDALALARALLKHPTLTTKTFRKYMEAILIHADHLRRWKNPVEQAFARFTNRQKNAVRFQMLSFYVSIPEWGQASSFLTKTPRHPADLMFSTWTLLGLGYTEEAQRIGHLCMQAIRRANDDLGFGLLFEALACLNSHVGALDDAEKFWSAATELEVLPDSAWSGLAQIHAFRSRRVLRQAATSMKKSLANWELEITLPKNNAAIRDEACSRFGKWDRALRRVVPDSELGKFGGLKETG